MFSCCLDAGSTGIQIAKAFGAKKIITTTSADNFAYCRALGADQLIDYKSTDWWNVLSESSIDVVYDTVGQKGTGDRAIAVLRSSAYFGFYVTITGTKDTLPSLACTCVGHGHIQVVG